MSNKKGGVKPEDFYIGKMLHKRRRALGMSQDALGKKVGVTFQQIQKYEAGKNRIAVSTLIKLARALDMAAEEFIPPEGKVKTKPALLVPKEIEVKFAARIDFEPIVVRYKLDYKSLGKARSHAVLDRKDVEAAGW